MPSIMMPFYCNPPASCSRWGRVATKDNMSADHNHAPKTCILVSLLTATQNSLDQLLALVEH